MAKRVSNPQLGGPGIPVSSLPVSERVSALPGRDRSGTANSTDAGTGCDWPDLGDCLEPDEQRVEQLEGVSGRLRSRQHPSQPDGVCYETGYSALYLVDVGFLGAIGVML